MFYRFNNVAVRGSKTEHAIFIYTHANHPATFMTPGGRHPLVLMNEFYRQVKIDCNSFMLSTSAFKLTQKSNAAIETDSEVANNIDFQPALSGLFSR